MPSLLNIGAGGVAVPPEYQGHTVTTLDLDPKVEPDILMDARDLRALEPRQYDAVYASHILEHFAPHEVDAVLWGIRHVLRDDGHAHIRVPDVLNVIMSVARYGLDLDALLYQSQAGPVHVCDVLWGFRPALVCGETFYQHKTGFSRDTLGRALKTARFEYVEIASSGYQLSAYAYKQRPEGK